MPDGYQRKMLGGRLREAIASDERWQLLSERLLALGGELIAVQFEHQLSELIERGRAWPTEHLQLDPGAQSRCHTNVARRWVKDHAEKPVSGWALSEDGIWRQHSWSARGDVVTETTVTRTAYFGFELTDIEAAFMAAAYGV